MANNFEKNWTTNNNNYPLDSKEVERYLSVKPSEKVTIPTGNSASFNSAPGRRNAFTSAGLTAFTPF